MRPGATGGEVADPVNDLAFVLLTIGVFVILTFIVKAVTRL